VVRDHSAVNDDDAVSLEEATVLLEEIERLRRELTGAEARLADLDRLAHRDSLVDLPNRRFFFAYLTALIGRVDQCGIEAAMLFVDLDGLKAINDKFGHVAGDKALIQVARLLAGSVRVNDVVARVAGDEFGILLEPTTELLAWQTALRVVETVDGFRFCSGGVCVPLSVAVGVTLIQAGDSPEAVLTRADKEMYRIKAIAGGPP
jgi:diguanylate cyclase (GGDEF)-like protein